MNVECELTSGVFAQQSKQAVAVKFRGWESEEQQPEVILVALKCWHEKVLATYLLIGRNETKGRTTGDERDGKPRHSVCTEEQSGFMVRQ